MDDIEDLVTSSTPEAEGRVYRPLVVPRRKKTTDEVPDKEDLPEGLPEKKKIYVRTFGCAHNVSDSEYMAGVLASEGYEVSCDAVDAKEADAWVINSCTVKDPSQAAFLRVVKEGLADGKGVVVAGCVPQAQQNIDVAGASVIGVKHLGKVGEAVEATFRGEKYVALSSSSRHGLPDLDLPKVRRNELVEIIPLSTGCLGACTYCKTRYARGKLGSYPLEAIAKRVRDALDDGVAEIWLSSEDTGAYGLDIGTNIGELLKRLMTEVDTRKGAKTMIRLGMTNPPYIRKHLDDVAEAFQHPNFFAFLHVPVQSGSDSVLAKDRMNREYTVADFDEVISGLRSRLGETTPLGIATDIICGFPGETDADFDMTCDLVTRYGLSQCNISQFYARPGTPAAKFRPRVPTATVKARSRRLSSLVNNFKPYVHLVGQTLDCYARDELTDEGNRLVAHTKDYVKVLIDFDLRFIGAQLTVRVLKAHRWHVDGVVVDLLQDADIEHRPALQAALNRLRRTSGSSLPSRFRPPPNVLVATTKKKQQQWGDFFFFLWSSSPATTRLLIFLAGVLLLQFVVFV